MGTHIGRSSWTRGRKLLLAACCMPLGCLITASALAQQPPVIPPPPDFMAGMPPAVPSAPTPQASSPIPGGAPAMPPPGVRPASPTSLPTPSGPPVGFRLPSAPPAPVAPAAPPAPAGPPPMARTAPVPTGAVAPTPGATPYIPPVPEINEELLVPAPEPGKAPRPLGYAPVDVPASGKGIPPISPLQSESGQEVIYENMQVEKQRRQEMEDRMRRKPNARSLRYRPLDNDPRLDPLDKGYQNWLKSVRQAQDRPSDIDPEYEQFVKDISVLMFSLGEKQLPVDTKEMLEQIPADSLKDPMRSLEVMNPVAIGRGETADPFPEAPENVDETVGVDVGLNIEVKSKGANVPSNLEMGYDALMSGQVEGAIALYKQVVDADPKNKEGLFGLATSYHRSGQLTDARSTYIELLKLYPDYWPAMNNFLVLAGEEAPKDALKELRELEQINPEFSPIAAQIGMVHLELGNLQEAVKYLSRAVILSPDNLGYRYNLAVVLDHAGYKAQAVRLYQQILAEESKGKTLPESRERIRERMAFIMSKDQYQ